MDIIYTPFISYIRIAASAHEKMVQYVNKIGFSSANNDDFQHTADGQATIVVIFCSISLECYIYNYASRKLGETFCEKHIEKMNLHTKWMIIPKLATGKSIPSDNKGVELLQKLIKARNNVVHLKAVNLKVESFEQQRQQISKIKEQILEVALSSFQCVGELGKALFELDPNEPGAKLFAGFLSTPKYAIVKKSQYPALLGLVEEKWIEQAFAYFRNNGKEKLYFSTNSSIKAANSPDTKSVYFKLKGRKELSLKADWIELLEDNPREYRLPDSEDDSAKYYYGYKNLRWLKNLVNLVDVKYYKSGKNLRTDVPGACIIADPQIE